MGHARVTRSASSVALGALACLALWAPPALWGQDGFVVQGRVTSTGAAAEIQNAIVELVGHGAMLTGESGTFRFEGVQPRGYLLRVQAFGYVAASRFVGVREDAVEDFELAAEPLLLDSLVVEARTLDFDGRVRDSARDAHLMNAQVLTDQGHEEWSNEHGRFDLDGVLEGVPLRVAIRAFGYLPLDTSFLPGDDGRRDFELHPDPFVEAMIAAQARRLEGRAGERLYEHRPALGRDDMARYSGFGTLAVVLDARLPPPVRRLIGCIVFDEERVRTPQERRWVMRTLPEELERVELLEYTISGGRALMMRVYTREFFQELVARNTPLREPDWRSRAAGCR